MERQITLFASRKTLLHGNACTWTMSIGIVMKNFCKTSRILSPSPLHFIIHAPTNQPSFITLSKTYAPGHVMKFFFASTSSSPSKVMRKPV